MHLIACAREDDIAALPFRDAPWWYRLSKGRHIGIYKPRPGICTWTARLVTEDRRYRQKALGPALGLQHMPLSWDDAVALAKVWFETGDADHILHRPRPNRRTSSVNFCPIGECHTVGHALRDYTEWTQIARSEGGHYSNLVLINHHLSYDLLFVPVEAFGAAHLATLAKRVIETPPHHGFSGYGPVVSREALSAEDLRRRKRTFNSLVTILRMAFQHAWESGNVPSERPWKSIKRIAVSHTPRALFLSRDECRTLIDCSSPALSDLIRAALYSGCRVTELGRLRVEDVGREIYGLHIRAIKRSPARFVFLPDEGMAFFLAHCRGKGPKERVLSSHMGSEWTRQHLRLFRRAVRDAGLPPAFVFHGLRHTYASDLVEAGVALEIVAKQLGHVDSRTVNQTYGHLSERLRESQIRERFTPLHLDRVPPADMLDELADLRSRHKKTHWRDYGTGAATAVGPLRARVRTSHDVLRAFGEIGPD